MRLTVDLIVRLIDGYTQNNIVHGLNTISLNGEVIKPTKIQPPYYIFCNLSKRFAPPYKITWENPFFSVVSVGVEAFSSEISLIIRGIPNELYPFSRAPIGIMGNGKGIKRLRVLTPDTENKLIYHHDDNTVDFPIHQSLKIPMEGRRFRLKSGSKTYDVRVTGMDEALEMLPNVEIDETKPCEVTEYIDMMINKDKFYCPIPFAKVPSTLEIEYQLTDDSWQTEEVNITEPYMTTVDFNG